MDPSGAHPVAFVKRGNPTLHSEAGTQRYLFELSKSGAKAPLVPRVYDAFCGSTGHTYLVMEDIPFPTFNAWINEVGISDAERCERTDIATSKIADTISSLLECPLPADNRMGPVGEGFIQMHPFFGWLDAPLRFVNALALENYANEVSLTLTCIGPFT